MVLVRTYLFGYQQSIGPQGFWGAGEKGYLFSGSWGALLIILGELGSKHILLGIKGALPKSKKNKYQASILFNSLKFCWLLGAIAPRPPYINVISFQFLYLSFRDIQYKYTTYHLIIWREAWIIFAPQKTYFLRCFHFICNRSPNPHNCCKKFSVSTLFLLFVLYHT